MKTVALVLLLISVPASAALAHRHDGSCCTIHSVSCSSPARWAPRHDSGNARLAINNQDNKVTLLLDDDVVAVQLSDRVLHKVERKFRDEEEEAADDNSLARVIKTAVFTSVRSILDHSVECPIRDLRDVDYRDGELVFISEGGRRVFRHLECDDENLMETFSEHDARAFVREFRALKQHAR